MVADAATEKNCWDFHLNEGDCHIVLMGNVSDIVVTMSFNNIVWSFLQYEPLILYVVLPFHRYTP